MQNGSGPIVNAAHVEFDGLYAGLWVDLRLNVPYSTRQDLLSGDETRFMRGLKRIVVGWNFLDDEGKAIPTGEFGEVDAPLQDELVARYFEELGKAVELPKA